MFLIEERKKHKQTKAPTEDCLPQYTVIFSVPVSDPGLFRGHGQNRFPTTLQLLFGRIFFGPCYSFFPLKNVCYIVRSHRISLFCSQTSCKKNPC